MNTQKKQSSVKKFLSLALVAGMLSWTAAPAWAVELGAEGTADVGAPATWTFSAAQDLTSLSAVEATVNLVDVTFDANGDLIAATPNNESGAIHWGDGNDGTTVNLESSAWVIATNVVQIDVNITNPDGRIEIYTDNVTGGYTGSLNPAGLYASNDNAVAPIAMAWRALETLTEADTTVTLNPIDVEVDFNGDNTIVNTPNSPLTDEICLGLSVNEDGFAPYHFFFDQGTTADITTETPDDDLCTTPIDANENGTTIYKAGGETPGYQFAPGQNNGQDQFAKLTNTDSLIYVQIAADFTNALASNYTSTVVVELTVE